MAINTPQVTSILSAKRVAAYVKQTHKTHRLYVERVGENELYIADGNLLIKTAFHPDLAAYVTFPQGWARATFNEKDMMAKEGGGDCQRLWTQMTESLEFHGAQTLTMTNFLYEVAGAMNKPGTLYRKLATYDLQEEKRVIYVEKRHMDMLSPDIDEVKGFLFEQSGDDKPVRIAAVHGYVAWVMPGYNIGRR